jgi:Flp pilus assembly protein TadD
MNSLKISVFSLLAFFLIQIPAGALETSSEVEGQIRYGIRAAKEDRWDEAIYRWRKALLLDPNNMMAHNNLAVAYEQTGDYELAMEEYQMAYRLDSQNQIVKSNLERFKDFYRKYQRQKR